MKAELDIYKTVKKSNVLNELRNANASLVEYRLFCVYLAHLPINSEDNVVTFTLNDYARIVGLGRPRYDDLKEQSDNLLGMTAAIDIDGGGFKNRNLFSEFTLFREDNQWMVSLECNAKIAPLIREQRGRFLRYKLYNTIYLKSFNQQRIYELLKQYEKIGERTMTLEELRAYLSIGENEYPVWGDFAQKVLKKCQRALKDRTDICFDYEPIKKGRPVVAVKFTIFKNKGFVDPMEMDKFMPEVADDEFEGAEFSVHADEEEYEQTSLFDDIDPLAHERDLREEICEGFQFEFFDEFSLDQLREFYELSKEHIDKTKVNDLRKEYGTGEQGYKQAMDTVIYDYVKKKILYVKSQGADRSAIGYIRKAIAEDYR